MEICMKCLKRYEYYSREGKRFTSWFEWNSDIRDPWQLNNKLKNEYKEIKDD